jgi:ribosome-interacting GTPase 1
MRLNQEPPNITFKRKKTGGLKINNTVPLTHLSPKTIKGILNEFKVHNAEILFRCDATAEQLLDVIQGNCKYVPCIYVYNKIDNITMEEVDEYARMSNSVVVRYGDDLLCACVCVCVCVFVC